MKTTAILFVALMLAAGASHAERTYVSHTARCIDNFIEAYSYNEDGTQRIVTQQLDCPQQFTVSVVLPDEYVSGVRYEGWGGRVGDPPKPQINMGLEFGDEHWWFVYYDMGDGTITIDFASDGNCCIWYTNHYQSGEWSICDDEGCYFGEQYFDYTLGRLRFKHVPPRCLACGSGRDGRDQAGHGF
jgi:hypothetical protein